MKLFIFYLSFNLCLFHKHFFRNTYLKKYIQSLTPMFIIYFVQRWQHSRQLSIKLLFEIYNREKLCSF